MADGANTGTDSGSTEGSGATADAGAVESSATVGGEPETANQETVPAISDEISQRVSAVDNKTKPLSLGDVPEGFAGIEWLQKNRERVFDWTKREIHFDNGGGPPGSELCLNARARCDRISTGKEEDDIVEKTDEEGLKRKEYKNHVKSAQTEAAKLLNCESDEIAFIQNTATGINIVADGIDWQRGDEVIICRGDKEYPTNFLPWKRLAKKGVIVKEIGDEDGVVRPEHIKQALSPRTRLVSVSSVGWKNGQRVDLEAIGKIILQKNKVEKQRRGIARAIGETIKRKLGFGQIDTETLFHVDGIQSVGAIPLDVKKCNIDFLSCGGHKWLLASNGVGIFYCREEAIKKLPNAPIGADSLKNFRDANSGLRTTARVFEIGDKNFAGIYGLEAALQLANKVGVENIFKKIKELTEYLADGLVKKGYRIVSPREKEEDKSGMVLFSCPEWDSEKDIQKREDDKIYPERDANVINPHIIGTPRKEKLPIEEKDILISVRGGALRASIHYYNTEQEIDELLQRLPDRK